MLVLGLDPGVALTGYGLVECGRSLRAVAYNFIMTPAELEQAERLKLLYEELSFILAHYQPQQVAVEELFFNRNVRTAMAVGQARGVALLAAAQSGAKVFEYTPAQVKKAVTGSGRAQKGQVQFMVRALLGLASVPQPDDVTDALAVAICHCHGSAFPGGYL
ncbi:MAG: crossover junction endodeoxyribonuclease RuvC [Bacillota bacterium]